MNPILLYVTLMSIVFGTYTSYMEEFFYGRK